MITGMHFVDFSINPTSKSRWVDIFDLQIPHISRVWWKPL